MGLCALPLQAAESPLAKELFKNIETPTTTAPQSLGSYARGCLAGGVRLLEDGPTWAAMRPSRGRNWGYPALTEFIARLSAGARRIGYNGLLIGDMGRARGGPMIGGHRSHQIGLDVDVWLRPLTERPTVQQREDWSSYDVVEGRSTLDRELWNKSSWRAIEIAARDDAVARIFVNPTIKRALCEATPGAGWLRKVRPWWGHDSHFHVRLACPAGVSGCVNQAPPPAGDGCGKGLAWWFTEEPYQPSDKKPKELTMADLPKACRAVLDAK
jgi:penicillin-insensitive murein endopeptidase